MAGRFCEEKSVCLTYGVTAGGYKSLTWSERPSVFSQVRLECQLRLCRPVCLPDPKAYAGDRCIRHCRLRSQTSLLDPPWVSMETHSLPLKGTYAGIHTDFPSITHLALDYTSFASSGTYFYQL